MNITKIKRILSKFGIGNPLNQLMYTHAELIAKGIHTVSYEHIDKRRFNKGRPRKIKEVIPTKGLWAVQLYSGIVVNKKFKDFNNAVRWMNWNYRGQDVGKVIGI